MQLFSEKITSNKGESVSAIDKALAIMASEAAQPWPVIEPLVEAGKVPFFGPYFKEVRQVEGKPSDFYFFTRGFTWSVMAGFTPAMEFITIIQPKHGANKPLWELSPGGVGKRQPEGTIAVGSTIYPDIATATLEEFFKDTGYRTEPSKVKELGQIMIESGKYRGERIDEQGFFAHLFLGTDLVKVGEPQPNPGDRITVLLVPLQEIPLVLNSPLFVEESAVAAVYKAMESLGYLSWKV